MNEQKYNVVQFLETPYKEIADYVCVPRSWVQTRGPDDPKVKVAYPDEDLLTIEKKIKKRNKKSDQWKSYLSVVKYRTDSYGDAKRYIQELLNNEDKYEDEKPRRSSRKPTPSAKMNMMEALRLIPTSENGHKAANTTAQKRKALPDSDKDAHYKRSKVNEPNKIDDEVAGPSNQTFELMSDNQSLTPANAHSVQDLYTQKAFVPEEKPTVNENPSESKHTLDSETIKIQETFGEFCRYELQELQTNLQIYTTSQIFKTIKKILSNANAFSVCRFNNPNASILKNLPKEGPKLNENKGNAMQAQTKHDDDDLPLQKISSRKRINKVVLPPEYDENDSRWTLKYREPAPGLVELMDHSGVYVNADKLAECKKQSNNCQTLAEMLLTEIFTANALSVCLVGNDFGIDWKHDGPELDTHATVTLLKFVAEYGLQQDWEVNDYVCILKGIRKKIEERGGHRKSTMVEHCHRRRFLPPPEYDQNDSKWTLKYREPAPGLVELMKHSAVYVNALKLANCKRLSRDSKTLARMLLIEIFTSTALSTCSWTGARAKAFDQHGTNIRPGLDEHARTVLLNYVAERAKKEGWNNCENQTIVNSMRNKMQEMRFKYKG